MFVLSLMGKKAFDLELHMQLVFSILLRTHPHPFFIQTFIPTCSTRFLFLTLISCRHTHTHSLSFVVCLLSETCLPNVQYSNPGPGALPVLQIVASFLLCHTHFNSGRAVIKLII